MSLFLWQSCLRLHPSFAFPVFCSPPRTPGSPVIVCRHETRPPISGAPSLLASLYTSFPFRPDVVASSFPSCLPFGLFSFVGSENAPDSFLSSQRAVTHNPNPQESDIQQLPTQVSIPHLPNHLFPSIFTRGTEYIGDRDKPSPTMSQMVMWSVPHVAKSSRRRQKIPLTAAARHNVDPLQSIIDVGRVVRPCQHLDFSKWALRHR